MNHSLNCSLLVNVKRFVTSISRRFDPPPHSIHYRLQR
jgi:hypothetical protein